MTERIGRKALFDVFRREPEQKTPSQRSAFDLAAFYGKRAEDGTVTRTTIPEIALRAFAEPVATSGVGVERSRANVPAHAAHTPLPIDGRVRIREHTCLAWQRSFCTTCLERCPVRAIVIEEGRPRVSEVECNGCGICVAVCPAPINGFDIVRRETPR